MDSILGFSIGRQRGLKRAERRRGGAHRAIALAPLLAALAVGLLVVGNGVRSVEAATFAVDSIGDTGDTAAGDGVCESTAPGTDCTLRAAIEEANALAGPDVINFNILAAGLQTITPATALPNLTEEVTINGYTQGVASPNTLAVGNNAVLLIALRGPLPGGADGLVIAAPNVVIRGLNIHSFTGGLAAGIRIAPAGTNATIAGNFMGTDAAGSGAGGFGNRDAVYVLAASGGTIGGTAPADRNLLSGNGDYGIEAAVGGSGLVVQGNYIGTIASGAGARTNGRGGIHMEGTSATIGGSAAGAGNVISSNSGPGVRIVGAGAVVQGNIIGLDATGTSPLGNLGAGVEVTGGSPLIGGSAAGAGNVISRNAASGVVVSSSAPTLRGNLIGTNGAGTVAQGNTGPGVNILGGAGAVMIGGSGAGEGNVISSNTTYGVLVAGAGGPTIAGNKIGMNVTGTGGLPNTLSGVSLSGATNVTIGGAAGTTPGGACTGACNLISRNLAAGIEIVNSALVVPNNVNILGNMIGLDASGTVDQGNSQSGIRTVARGVVIGGTSVNARNVISGNDLEGVLMSGCGANCHTNRVEGNYIGTDTTGTLDRGNTRQGVVSSNNTNTIGGLAAGAGNLISGNNLDGINIGGATSNVVQGNYIGTNASGTAGVGNSTNGIFITSGSNTIGGNSAAARNVISSNLAYGVTLLTTAAFSNVVHGNYIGTDAAGTGALGNGFSGVSIDQGATLNLIGGIGAGEGNIIANNNVSTTFQGIRVSTGGFLTYRNPIRGNSVYSNVGLGLDLNGDGVSANDLNDPDTNANLTQNYPVMTEALSSPGATRVRGSLNSTLNTLYQMDVYTNPACDASMFGEGRVYIASTSVTTVGNNVTFDIVLPAASTVGDQLTLTVTDPIGNTSEFSRCMLIELDSDGDGIKDANDNCDFDPNPLQENFDADALGDVCDPDDDNDGMPDAYEDAHGCLTHFGADAGADPDADTLTNIAEMNAGTLPCDPDSDDDTFSDGEEVAHGSLPLNAASTPEGPAADAALSISTCDEIDNDLDTLVDEGFVNTDGDGQADCVDPDDDNDTFSDADEATYGSLPLNAASTPEGPAADAALSISTCDGLDNDLDTLVDEGFVNTDGDGQADCVDPDDDNDTFSDADEATYGSLPLNPASTPEGPAADAALSINTCDGIDNDLDTLVDEGFVNTDGDGQADCVDPDDDNDTFSDADEATYGSLPLNAASTPEGPTADAALSISTCDGIDNDLDTAIDESFVNTDGDGQADCVDPDDDNDTFSDADEATYGSLPLNPASTPEGPAADAALSINTCDGLDNDLDTAIDEGFSNNDALGGPFGGTQAWIVDGVGPEGASMGCDAMDINDDNDLKCTDVEETTAPLNLGGARNPLNPWDFADVPVPALTSGNPSGVRNGVVQLADALATVYYAGAANNMGPNSNGVDYDTDLNANGVEDGAEYDRSPAGAISGPPNGAVALQDALVVFNQSGHNCTAAPN